MSIWAIGDLQGCCDALEKLLNHPEIQNDPDPVFWFAGDLINRGPDSLGTLRLLMSMDEQSICVLGNHDLNVLAQIAKKGTLSKSSTVQQLLAAPDAYELVNWLRHRPLAHLTEQYLMVHAGVLPTWSASTARALAREIEDSLRGPDWQRFLLNSFGDQPAQWNDALDGFDRSRVIINALTRLRYCRPDGSMEFESKTEDAPEGYLAWFDVPKRNAENHTIIFGHWSTLGLIQRSNLIGLDTGCIWGGQLTAMRLDDRLIVQYHCPNYKTPKAPDIKPIMSL